MSNVLQASFFRRRELRGLQKVTVRQKFSNHTLAFLDYRIDSRRDYLLPPENTPTQARWGSGPTGVQTTYGYINHHETVTDERDRALTRMVLVGTSKTLNSMSPSSWQGQTRSGIARDIAQRHRMRSVIHQHPYVLENWATGTRTDFQALKALADEAGYRLWVDGATLWLLDPSKILRTASSMSTPVIRRDSVKAVQVLGGSNIPGEMNSSTRQVQFGLDYRTNEFFLATSGDTAFPSEVSTATVTSFSEAQEIADAAERKQQDQFVLKATFDGNARITPGSLVQVESGRVNNDQTGLWLVTEAVHEISPANFLTSIVATRGIDQQPVDSRSSTTRDASGLNESVVRDGVTWEAALQEHVHV